MNKVTKIFLGAGAFLVMAGGLLALGGWAMGGQTSLELDGGRLHLGAHGIYTTGANETADGTGGSAEELALAPFTKLDVDVDLGDVLVTEGDDYGVSLYWQGKNYELRYQLDGDTLKVWSAAPGGINFGMGQYDASAIVYVPAGVQLEKAEITSSLGDVEICGLLTKALDADCDLGDLTLNGVTADSMELDVSLGGINASALTVRRELDANNDMGDIFLEGSLKGTLDISDSMGSIQIITDIPRREYSYQMEVSMGTITLDGEEQRHEISRSGGPNHMEIDNDMGDIDVEFG